MGTEPHPVNFTDNSLAENLDIYLLKLLLLLVWGNTSLVILDLSAALRNVGSGWRW
jgi:hypothetical protein